MKCSSMYDNLYPANAPNAEGIGNTISRPKSVTYFGLFTIVPINT